MNIKVLSDSWWKKKFDGKTLCMNINRHNLFRPSVALTSERLEFSELFIQATIFQWIHSQKGCIQFHMLLREAGIKIILTN